MSNHKPFLLSLELQPSGIRWQAYRKKPMNARNAIPHLALITAMLVWSSTFVTLKIALSAYSPMATIAGRMLTASVACLPLLPAILRCMRDAHTRRIMLLSALFTPCLYFLCESNALLFTSSAQAGMVMALQPVAVAVGAGIFLKERLPGRAWAGFALAVGGVLWLSLEAIATESAPNPLLGNGLEFMAVLSSAGYTLCVRHLSDKVSPLLQTAAMAFAGAVFFVFMSFLPMGVEPVILENDIPDWLPLVCVIYMGIVPTFGGFGLYSYGVSRLSAARAAAYTNGIPVMTLIMGVWFLGDRITFSQYAAAALVIAGICLSQSRK